LCHSRTVFLVSLEDGDCLGAGERQIEAGDRSGEALPRGTSSPDVGPAHDVDRVTRAAIPGRARTSPPLDAGRDPCSRKKQRPTLGAIERLVRAAAASSFFSLLAVPDPI
jgi:hypothetical protein